MRLLLAITASSMAATSAASAADFLSEGRARQAAIKILLGPPYGNTAADVARHITSAALVIGGDSICGKVDRPVWTFTVHVPSAENVSNTNEIRGYMCIDARTGKLSIAGLPFLD